MATMTKAKAKCKAKAKSAVEFAWRHKSYGDANEVGKELARIARRFGVADLKDIGSRQVAEITKSGEYPALHKAIWEAADTEEAAFRWRVNRAQHIINSLGYTVIDNSEKKVFVYRVPVVIRGEHRFVPVSTAVKTAELREQMLADLVAGIAGWQARSNELRAADRRPEVQEGLKFLDMALDRFRAAIDQNRPPEGDSD